MNLEAEGDATGSDNAASSKGTSGQGEPGKKAVPPEIPIQVMITYLVCHRDVTNEEFQRLLEQLKPWGCLASCMVAEIICATWRRGEFKDSTWDQDRNLAWRGFLREPG